MSHFRLLSATAALSIVGLAPHAHAQLPAGNWGLVFGDEFNGTTLDPDKWNYNYSWGNTHNHAAYMDPGQVQVGNGKLTLQAVRRRHANAENFYHPEFGWQSMDFTSGAVNTAGTFRLGDGGYVEARMKMPAVVGTWAAFWMLKEGWPPEIDIMEAPFTNYDDMYNFHQYMHYKNGSANPSFGQRKYAGTDITADFHNYGVEYDASRMTFYFDGAPVFTSTNAAAIAQAKDMYLILNLAVDGWAGTPPSWANFPANFEIDWVRAWEKTGATRSDFKRGVNGNANWDDAAFWTAGAPRLSTNEAFFGNNGAADVRLDWNATKTIGTLSFSSGTNHVIGYADDQLSFGGAGTADAYVNAYSQGGQGKVTIGSRVELASNLTVRNYTNNPVIFAADIHGTGMLTAEIGKTQLNGVATHTGGTRVIGAGELIVNGTLNTPADTLNVGAVSGANSILRVGPSGNVNTSALKLGDAGGRATGYQAGGAVNVGGQTWVGNTAGSAATFNQSAGTLTGSDWIAVGRDRAAGTYNLAGGTLVKKGVGNLIVGSLAGVGTFNQTGGTVDVQVGDTLLGEDNNGVNGSGTYSISAGTASLRNLVLSQRGGSAGTFNLNGGTVNVLSVKKTGSGVATFNFNGGYLRPYEDSTTFMQGLNAAYVKDGGALFETNGKSITVAQPLLNAGSGGLTKSGNGTLRLTGDSTYAGVTQLWTGTLVVNGKLLGTGNLNAAGGTTLAGSGQINASVATIDGGLRPGDNGVGTLMFAGLMLTPTSDVLIDLASSTSYDRVQASGPLDLRGNTLLALSLGGGYTPAAGTAFDVFDFTGLTGQFGRLSLPTLPATLGWDVSALYTTGVVSVVAVPEPAAAGLALMGFAAAALRRRRA